MVRIYAGNLPWAATDADLVRAFSQFGTVVSAQVVVDPETGRSRGFGFVEMETEAEAETAIKELDGAVWGGRTMVVSHARARSRRRNRRA